LFLKFLNCTLATAVLSSTTISVLLLAFSFRDPAIQAGVCFSALALACPQGRLQKISPGKGEKARGRRQDLPLRRDANQTRSSERVV